MATARVRVELEFKGVVAKSQINTPITTTGATYNAGVVDATTTPGVAIPLGELSPGAEELGWLFIKNLDSTNEITVTDATGGNALCELKAGEAALFRFPGSVTAPFVYSSSGTISVEYMLLEA